MTPSILAALRTLALTAGAVLALAAPTTAVAQSGGDGFLFREPPGSLTLRGGFGSASASSDIFSFAREEFTLARDDFDGVSIGAELALRWTPRVHVVLGAEYTGNTAESEYRKWVDNDDRPIEQRTTYQRVPITLGLKAYLVPPGRAVGSFAWVPNRIAPYVGAGAGGMWYRFRQEGDFIDTESLAVYSDVLESRGAAPTAHANAGVELAVTPRLAITGEGRYLWGRTGLDSAVYEGFEPIDLSGLSATIGFQLRF